jgi:polypeptide N-acetylgalactosaminyltransferase
MRLRAVRIPLSRTKILALGAVAVFVYLCAFRGRAPGASRANSEPLFLESEAVAVIRSEKNQAQYIGRDGVHVVVGRYVGDSISSNDVNLTEAELNANNFRPVAGAGANGDPVFVPGPDEWKAKRLFHANKFNLMASDRIPLNRTLPDVRRAACVSRVYDEVALPKASVVIVFHNEAWSTLLRTVQSVVDRSWYLETDGSRTSLVQEIILVDDASDRAFLRRPLDEHLAKLHIHAKVIRLSERVGLIK